MRILFKTLKVLASLLVVFLIVLSATIAYTSDCDTGAASGTAAAGSESSMQSVLYHCYGGPEVLELTDVDMPTPADDEVLVKVKAAGVNPLDWHYMRGSPYIMRVMSGIGAPSDSRMGVDFAGVVEQIGKNVTEFQIGDEVFGGANGAFAEYLTVRESRSIVKIPKNTSFGEAAAVPIAAVTALQALRDSGQLKSGQKVLINGASGGVGTYAVQIAKSMGAEVTGVCSTRNVELVKSLGADHIVNYKKEDFVAQSKVYDLIVDNVGNREISEYQSVLSKNGILVMVGGPKGDWIGPFKNSIGAAIARPFSDQQLNGFLASLNKKDMQVLATMLESGEIKSSIDKRFSFNDIDKAIEYSESGRARGKIVVDL